jgi:hypothetical protein
MLSVVTEHTHTPFEDIPRFPALLIVKTQNLILRLDFILMGFLIK